MTEQKGLKISGTFEKKYRDTNTTVQILKSTDGTDTKNTAVPLYSVLCTTADTLSLYVSNHAANRKDRAFVQGLPLTKAYAVPSIGIRLHDLQIPSN